MHKRLIAIFLITLLICGTATSSIAHTAQGHYKDMSRVLFQTTYPFINRSPQKNPEQHKAIWALRYVYQVAIDQFNWSEERHNNETAFSNLSSLCGIHHMPPSISIIDLPNVNSITHREYTHMGWNVPTPLHPVLGSEWTSRWATRKYMILSTVEQIFNFNGSPDFWDTLFPSYTQECDAFCALLYYVHLLGDHIGFSYDTYIKESRYMLALSGTIPGPRQYKQSSPPNIISEFIYYSYILFGKDAKFLVEDLRIIGEQLNNLPQDVNGFVTEEAFPEYKRLAEQVLNKLEHHIPRLLKTQTWWKNVFLKE